MAEGIKPILSGISLIEEDEKIGDADENQEVEREEVETEESNEIPAEPAPEPEPEPEPEPSKPAEPTAQPPSEERDAQAYQFNLPKRKRVQVDPNASVKDLDSRPYLTSLPVVPESDVPYTPILYTFRVKAKGNMSNLKHLKTKPPPFYLQFDHAIAVIWTLFNKEANKENLGIAQLQWALHFLQSIYTAEGIHPKDVQLCIDTIQDHLIELYAAMSGEAVIYYPSNFAQFHKSTEQKKDIGVSLNYTLVEEKSPAISLENKESQIIDKELLAELENVKKAVGIDSIDLANVYSKEQVMAVLNDWKREQIEKIQGELSMLYVVEDMMKNSDAQNFEGYTDETQFEDVFRRDK